MKLSNFLKTSVVSALLVFSASSSANIINASSNTTPFIISNGNYQNLPLYSSGTTTLSFYASSTARKAVLFTAECSIKSSDRSTWYRPLIQVRRYSGGSWGSWTTIAPTNGDQALCTSNGSNSLDGWATHTQQATFYPSGTGSHQVRVRGILNGFSSGEQARIDEISVLISE